MSVKFRGKKDLQVRQALAPFPHPVLNEDELKIVLLEMAYSTSNKRPADLPNPTDLPYLTYLTYSTSQPT